MTTPSTSAETPKRKYLIVNEDHRPVSWSTFSKRLCLNIYPQFKVRLYSKKEAERFIKLTNEAKWKAGGLSENYRLLPVAL